MASRSFVQRHALDIGLISPLLIFIFGFTLIPVLTSIGYSFVDPVSKAFPSLANYAYMFEQNTFREAVVNTLVITGVGLTLEMALALGLALMLTREFKGQGIVRSILLLPMGVPTLVSAVVMSYIFSLSGYANELLFKLGLATVPVVWTGGGFLTLMTVVFADMWKVTPMVMLMLLAGLQAIPKDVYEAGDVDGVTTWQRFTLITLPLLQPAITMALILRAIDAFRIFDLTMVLGGKQTPVVATFSYYEWAAYNNPYTSGAGATILLLMILVFVLGYLKVVEGKREDLD
ncbi:MAG: carbohydrate ABC transporter permease [Candidatus Sericytochromatia bacterium]